MHIIFPTHSINSELFFLIFFFIQKLASLKPGAKLHKPFSSVEPQFRRFFAIIVSPWVIYLGLSGDAMKIHANDNNRNLSSSPEALKQRIRFWTKVLKYRLGIRGSLRGSDRYLVVRGRENWMVQKKR